MRARTGQFAAECLRCQFAGVAPLRSALHSDRTFVTRGRYLLTGAALLNVECGKWNAELLLHYALLRRRHAGVLFLVALVTIAAYKASLRVQSERSERLRE